MISNHSVHVQLSEKQNNDSSMNWETPTEVYDRNFTMTKQYNRTT